MSVILNMGHTPNYATLHLGSLTLHFSYSTVIGFADDEDSALIQNYWGPTTGKHLNALDGGYKKDRLPKEEFDSRLTATLKRHGL